VSVISACVKGDMACASAAALLSLSMRQVRRLQRRLGEDGEATLAHAPPMPASTIITSAKNSASSRAFPCAVKPCADLLRQAGLGSPRRRRASAHRQRRLRSAREGELALLITGSKVVAPGSGGDEGDAELFESATDLSGVLFSGELFGDRPGVVIAQEDGAVIAVEGQAGHRSGAGVGAAARDIRKPIRWRRNLPHRPKAASNAYGACCKTASARTPSGSGFRSALGQCRARSLYRRLQPPLRPPFAENRRGLASRAPEPGSHLLLRPCPRGQSRQRRAMGRPTLPDPAKAAVSTSPAPRSTCIRLSTAASPSTTVKPNSNTPWLRQGDIFMLL
jgi:hypothetical protein